MQEHYFDYNFLHVHRKSRYYLLLLLVIIWRFGYVCESNENLEYRVRCVSLDHSYASRRVKPKVSYSRQNFEIFNNACISFFLNIGTWRKHGIKPIATSQTNL